MFKRLFNFLKIANNPGVENEYVPPPDNDKIISKLFSNKFHKDENIHQLESWLFYSYFNSHDNLTEKKYKMAVLSLVCNQYSVYLSKMPIIDDIVKNYSKELIDGNETCINLYEVFPTKEDNHLDAFFMLLSSMPVKLQGIELIPKILEEDKENFEKIEIAKKVYNKFSCLGLLANTFIKSKSYYDIFMQFQDSKFTNGDINNFNQFIKNVTDPKYNGYHSVCLNIDQWNLLILNENNIDNLNVFKQLYLNDKSKDIDSYHISFYSTLLNNTVEDPHEVNKKYLIDLVDKRIDYVQLNNYLETHSETNNKKVKRAKI